jgi:hypothetical protein
VVDGLCKPLLENLSLQPTLHQSLRGELEDIIEGVLLVSHETVALQAADKRRSFEKSLGVLVLPPPNPWKDPPHLGIIYKSIKYKVI